MEASDTPSKERPAPSAQSSSAACTCAACEQELGERVRFVLGAAVRCLRRAACYRPMLRRATATALVVGTILVAINQGAVLASGAWHPPLLWQIPLTSRSFGTTSL